MKIKIENLRAQMKGVQLDSYKKGLALDEYYKLLDYVEELEKLGISAVRGSCEWCDTEKENPDGLCKKCGRFPSPSNYR